MNLPFIVTYERPLACSVGDSGWDVGALGSFLLEEKGFVAGWAVVGTVDLTSTIRELKKEVLCNSVCCQRVSLCSCERRQKLITLVHANLVFRACISFLRCPKNLFGLFLTSQVISILQGYFWRPSENIL